MLKMELGASMMQLQHAFAEITLVAIQRPQREYTSLEEVKEKMAASGDATGIAKLMVLEEGQLRGNSGIMYKFVPAYFARVADHLKDISCTTLILPMFVFFTW